MFAVGPAFFGQAASAGATLAVAGSFASATVGMAYSSSLPITGGLEPYALTGGTGVVSGALDSGFALSITGSVGARFLTLTCASPATADTMTFTASIGSSDGQTATSAQSVTVSALAASTLNPADKDASLALSSGNLVVTKGGSNGHCFVRSTRGLSSGKWYWEVEITAAITNDGQVAAITQSSVSTGTSVGASALGYSFDAINGTVYNNGGSVNGFGAYTTGDRIMVALDVTTGDLWFGKNGTWLGLGANPATGNAPAVSGIASGTWFPTVGLYDVSSAAEVYFAAASQAYSAPSGFTSVG